MNTAPEAQTHTYINEGEDLCHIQGRNEEVPACGVKGAKHCVGRGVLTPMKEVCIHCGRVVCPTCLSIKRTYNRGGGYEGAD